MKRIYYIANSYDGKYFVLTDTPQEYAQSLSIYLHNLTKSHKTNHYSFGTVEMTQREYEDQRKKAGILVKELTEKSELTEVERDDKPKLGLV
jgi:hypothetical protein